MKEVKQAVLVAALYLSSSCPLRHTMRDMFTAQIAQNRLVEIPSRQAMSNLMGRGGTVRELCHRRKVYAEACELYDRMIPLFTSPHDDKTGTAPVAMLRLPSFCGRSMFPLGAVWRTYDDF